MTIVHNTYTNRHLLTDTPPPPPPSPFHNTHKLGCVRMCICVCIPVFTVYCKQETYSHCTESWIMIDDTR